MRHRNHFQSVAFELLEGMFRLNCHIPPSQTDGESGDPEEPKVQGAAGLGSACPPLVSDGDQNVPLWLRVILNQRPP